MVDPFEQLSQQPQDSDPFAKLSKTTTEAETDPFAKLTEVKRGQIDDEDLQRIASIRGISVEVLKKALPFFTGLTGPSTPDAEFPEKLAGETGKVLFELPQKLYVLSKSDPKVREALDDLRALIEDRKTGTQMAAEIATATVPAVAAAVLTGGASAVAPISRAIIPEVIAPALGRETAKRTIARAAVTGAIEGAAGGALTGVGRSRTGEELKGAAEGAIFPGVVGAGVAGTFRAAQAYKLVKKELAEEIDQGLRALNKEVDITGKVEAKLDKTKVQDNNFITLIQDEKKLRSIPAEIKAVKEEIVLAKEAGEDIKPLLKRQKELVGQAARVREFGSFVSGKSNIGLDKAIDEISKQSAVFGEEIASTYKTFRQAEIIPEILGEISTAGDSKLSKQAQRALDLSVSGRYAAADIDRALKTNAVRIIDDFAPANTAFQLTVSSTKTVLNNNTDLANKANITPEEITSILRRATTAEEIRTLVPDKKQAEAVIAMRNFFDNVPKDVQMPRSDRTPIKIGTIEKYAPQKLVDDAVIIYRLDKVNRQIENQLSTKLANPSKEATKQMRSLMVEYHTKIRPLMIFNNVPITEKSQKIIDEFNKKAGSFGTLLHAADYLTQGKLLGKTSPPKLEDLLRFTRSLDNTEFLGARTEKIAGSALERTLRAPEVVLENNVFKLAQKYAYDIYRTAYYKKTVDGLKGVLEVAKRAGDTKSAAWVDNALKDLAGIRSGTGLAKYKEITQAVQVWALKRSNEVAPNSVAHHALTFIGESPEILSSMINSVYPYFLGSSLRSFVNNLGGATFTLAPEVGVMYSPNVFQSYLKFGKLLTVGKDIVLSETSTDFLNKTAPRAGNPYKVGEVLRTRNPSLVVMNTLGGSGSLSHEAFSTLNKALDKSAVARVSTKVINTWTNASMYLFEKSESINRFVALEVGQDIARDLMAKDPKALSLLGKMDQSYRIALSRAIDSNNAGEVQRLTQRWLVAKTMFDYNRLNQAEAARFMGPLFSTFTTYPANVWGDVVNTLRDQGKLKGGADLVARRLMPMMAAMAISSYFIPEYGENETVDLLLGKERLAAMPPLASVTSLTTRGITPPALQVAGQGLKAAATADVYEFWKFFNSGMAFLPGASFIKFIGADLPTAIYGPLEGKTVLGKTVETFSGGRILLDESIKEFTRDYKESLTNP